MTLQYKVMYANMRLPTSSRGQLRHHEVSPSSRSVSRNWASVEIDVNLVNRHQIGESASNFLTSSATRSSSLGSSDSGEGGGFAWSLSGFIPMTIQVRFSSRFKSDMHIPSQKRRKGTGHSLVVFLTTWSAHHFKRVLASSATSPTLNPTSLMLTGYAHPVAEETEEHWW